MQKFFKKGTFLSILFHLLLLMCFSTLILFKPETPEQIKKTSHYYVPAYVYKGAITPARQQQAVISKPQVQEKVEEAKQSDFKSSQKGDLRARNFAAVKKHTPRKSILEMSRNMIQQNQLEQAMQSSQEEEPILLIGDHSAIADPLIKLIGRVLSANFRYPETEGRLGMRGRVLVSLVIHPEGIFTDVQIVQSSDVPAFDSAALFAVNTAPRAQGIEKLLPKSRHFVVGFLFE